MLIQNAATNNPRVNALMALMCFHASRFDARATDEGESILCHEQDEQRWNQELIRGNYFWTTLPAISFQSITWRPVLPSLAYRKRIQLDKLGKHSRSFMSDYQARTIRTLRHWTETFAISRCAEEEQVSMEAEKHRHRQAIGLSFTPREICMQASTTRRRWRRYEKALTLAGSLADRFNDPEKHSGSSKFYRA